MIRITAWFVALLLCTLFLGACVAGNDRGVIGHPESGVHLAFLSEGKDRPEQAPRPDTPSVTTLARGNWQPTQVIVPVDGVMSNRRFARQYRLVDETNRQKGGPPIALSALDDGGSTAVLQVVEAAVAGPAAMYEAVAMPFRMAFFVDPYEVVRTLPETHWRRELGAAQVITEGRGTAAK